MNGLLLPLAWSQGLCSAAVASGCQQDDLWRVSLIEPRFDDERDVISSVQYSLLCMNLALELGDESHGLGGQGIPTGSCALVIRTMLGCRTLMEALTASQRLFGLLSSALKIGLHIEHDQALLVFECEARNETWRRRLEDCYAGFIYMCASHFLGRPMPVIEVVTRDPCHVNLGGMHWSALAPVRFANFTGIRIPKAVLNHARMGRSGKLALWDVFEPWIAHVEGSSNKATGSPIDLNASRTVSSNERQRQLCQLGIEMLTTTDYSVEAVAADLGYSDARSFRRFMKASTGRTPHEIRGAVHVAAGAQSVRARIRAMASQLNF